MDTLQRLRQYRPGQEPPDRHPFQTRNHSEGPSNSSSRCLSPPPSLASNIPTLSDSNSPSTPNNNQDPFLRTSGARPDRHSCSPSASVSRPGLNVLAGPADSADECGESDISPTGPKATRSPSPQSSVHSDVQHPQQSLPCSPVPGPIKTSTSSRKARNKSFLMKTRSKGILWKKFKPALVLENSGSVARDHLASERTFLAYVRTSLALASTGVALVQLFTIADLTSWSAYSSTPAGRRIQRFARPLGVTCIVFALIVLGIAVYRYFKIQHALPEQKFPVARISIAFISFVLGALVVVIFGALLSERV
ncbi:hypothetical protein JR316_0009509 [Psilocybe cubensis]|uniref:Uncharacterized protein n=2 Tax=Psilocybe cubensis TaxID=181762 RepID=A0ACB8GQM1_PSICU|nr:hypothetical protein JR316_0009509 [Psilocybe cubensis]KAH9477305.1 hypothetical protein JR316_0009509 [Psilocybe cubensis]